MSQPSPLIGWSARVLTSNWPVVAARTNVCVTDLADISMICVTLRSHNLYSSPARAYHIKHADGGDGGDGELTISGDLQTLK